MSATRWHGILPMRPASSRPSIWGRALLVVTLSLVAFGLISVYSASSYVAQAQGLEDSHFLFQQASRAGIGLVALAVALGLRRRVVAGEEVRPELSPGRLVETDDLVGLG